MTLKSLIVMPHQVTGHANVSSEFDINWIKTGMLFFNEGFEGFASDKDLLAPGTGASQRALNQTKQKEIGGRTLGM